MPQLDFEQYYRDYLAMLTLQTSIGQSRERRESLAEKQPTEGVLAASRDGLLLDASDFLVMLGRRETFRAAWRAFFTDWDVLIGPMVLDAAFPHRPAPDADREPFFVDGEPVPYMMNIVYAMWAILAGQPSTAFPAGLSSGGLPLGLQAIGPFLEDRTTLRFAQLLEREWHAFEAPPGY
jgi:amidase